MYISVLELFKVGIGPSSSHTMGPMIAANDFISRVKDQSELKDITGLTIICSLKGSLAHTGKGHATDRAILLGLHGYLPSDVAQEDIDSLVNKHWSKSSITLSQEFQITFSPDKHIFFDFNETLPEHPNGMVFEVCDTNEKVLMTETYFSIGGGFIKTLSEINNLIAPLDMHDASTCPYPFDSAESMLNMSNQSGLTIAEMKRRNELHFLSEDKLNEGLNHIWQSMHDCVENGLNTSGQLPGGLALNRRARQLHEDLMSNPKDTTVNDWLSAYAIAVNEENAAGHMVVTAPTNGAAGVIPAVLYYLTEHEEGISEQQIQDFLLTASAIGGLIKHRSSISGAEVGCQGEVGSAASMAAAGLCAAHGGTPQQIENAAEIALEHHLGMTCDPVNGLVQVPCIERNAFGAIKAFTASSLALHGDGKHFMPLDKCIAAMKQTGLEMSEKYKETSLGGLAVSITEC